MEKLIITCCTNEPRSYEGVKGLHIPVTVREVADSVRAARDAGAAVVHVHDPITPNFQGPKGFNLESWLEVVQFIRQESDVLFEHGVGGNPYLHCEHAIVGVPLETRRQTPDLSIERPDLIAVVAGFIHHPFGSPNVYVMPTREDLERWMLLCREASVKPSFEVWHIGHYYNIKWMADKGLIDPPYWLTLFIGEEGGVGSPPTLEELLHRVKNIPEHSLWQISVRCGLKGVATTKQQLALFALTITLGGHIRVGMEDNPYYWDGVPAESNAQLVERVVRIARDLGREVATPDEARQILGLPQQV